MSTNVFTAFPKMDYTREFLADQEKARIGQKIPRRLLITYANLGELFKKATTENPTRFLGLGRGVEESSLEFSSDIKTVTDIFGNSETTINHIEITQNFSPVTLRVGSELHKVMFQILDEKDLDRLSMFEILVVKAFWGQEINGKFYFPAELHLNSTIAPQSFGGDHHIDLPINTYPSNDKLIGWADIEDDDDGNKIATFYKVGGSVPDAPTFTRVTNPSNPKTSGLYELVSTGEYALSADTTASAEKTYYSCSSAQAA